MKKRRVWRYTCDFCKKSNCSPGSISRHERHCTMNPNRACRMCARVGDKQTPIGDLVGTITYRPDTEGIGIPVQFIDTLRSVAHNCPACILAALRQASEPDDGIFLSGGGWGWKAEREAWIEDYRASCFGTESSDMVFDRDEWMERRAKRYGTATVQAEPPH